MFPGVANAFFKGSTAANYFYGIYGINDGSYLDMLHQSDRIAGNPELNLPAGNCAYQIRLLHVLRSTRQLDAHLDERR